MNARAVRPDGMPPGIPSVPDPPAIPGLRFRGLRRPDDIGPAVALQNRCQEADGVEERDTPEEWVNWLAHNSRRDPDRDFLLAEVDGALVGFTGAGWDLDNDGGHNYETWGVVDPAWRRRGLGGALLRWTEARQRQVASGHAPGVEKRLESWCYGRETSRIALLVANGYTRVRGWFQMTRPSLGDLPEPHLPDGVEMRPVAEEHLRAIFDAEVAAFRDHFGGIDDTPEAFERFVREPTRDTSLWVVAWHGDEVVGISLNRINRAENTSLGIERGWVNAVGVVRAWRRKGLARSLVAESLRVLRDAGMTSAGLGVDAENPYGALKLYEDLGFAVSQEGSVYRKPLTIA